MGFFSSFKSFFRTWFRFGASQVTGELKRRVDHTDKLPEEMRADLKTAIDDTAEDAVESLVEVVEELEEKEEK